MVSLRTLPISLTAVAVLFIVAGFYGIIRSSVALAEGRIIIPVDAPFVLVGIGLLRLRRGWRTCAVFILWFSVVALAFVFFWCLIQGVTGNIPFTARGLGLYLCLAAGTLVLVGWMLRVLGHDDISALFGLQK